MMWDQFIREINEAAQAHLVRAEKMGIVADKLEQRAVRMERNRHPLKGAEERERAAILWEAQHEELAKAKALLPGDLVNG